MDIRKPLITPHAIMAFAMTVALAFPIVAEADSRNEVALQSSPSNVASAAATASASESHTADAQATRLATAIAVKQPAVLQDSLDITDGIFAALGLCLVILILWLILRYYPEIKLRIGINSQQDARSIRKPADSEPAFTKNVIKRPPQVENTHAPVVPPNASTARTGPVSPPPQKIMGQSAAEDAILEEAYLYATNRHWFKAIEILEELIKQCPSKADAWTLLLSVYSALGKADEFNKAAKEFLKHNENSPSWPKIQALGRTFDPNNPLYMDISSSLPANLESRRTVGDILIEMGILSKQDIKNCLDDFDPKKHGRFGGYLVSSKIITLEQLNQALLRQQGVGDEVNPDTMPSLQELEHHLTDFNLKRDRSVGEFLASRKDVAENIMKSKTSNVSGHIDIKQAITNLDSLPAMPIVARKLLALKLDTEEGKRMLLVLIEDDPQILAKILGLSNSALVGASRHISTAKDAAMLLGLKSVQSTATCLAILSLMSKMPEGKFSTQGFWLHSIGVAFAMQGIARMMPAKLRPQDDQIFLAGMLHDIGYLALAFIDPKHSDKLHTRLAAESERPSLDVEREVMEICHDELGAELGRHWNLPEEIIAVLRYHHNPDVAEAATAQPLVRMINIAEKLLPSFGITEYVAPGISDEEWAALGISPSKSEEVKEHVDEQAEQAIQLASSFF